MKQPELDQTLDQAEELPFWQRKSLKQMSDTEWESLCDGCGKCCLIKLEDIPTGDLLHTNAVCYLMDQNTCRCSRYSERQTLVPDCIKLTSYNVPEIEWLPSTCAYRLVAEGKDLPNWHPLRSGDRQAVHKAGVSVRSWAVCERDVDDIEEHIIDWRP